MAIPRKSAAKQKQRRVVKPAKKRQTPKGELSREHLAFCEALLADPHRHATRAYMQAFPKSSKKSAEVSASRLLAAANIQAYIGKREAELRQQMRERYAITQQRVAEELAFLAFARMEDLVTWGPGGVRLIESDALDPRVRAGVVEISEKPGKFGSAITIKLDKRGALNLLGQHLGMFKQNVELEFSEGLRKLFTDIAQHGAIGPGHLRAT